MKIPMLKQCFNLKQQEPDNSKLKMKLKWLGGAGGNNLTEQLYLS